MDNQICCLVVPLKFFIFLFESVYICSAPQFLEHDLDIVLRIILLYCYLYANRQPPRPTNFITTCTIVSIVFYCY